MNDAVFISDLHLNPAQPEILERFLCFIQWAAVNTRAVYILGDFFHVWAGDDGIDSWSEGIAQQLSWLSTQGVSLYYMHGNRDFLLGRRFAELASFQILPDPSVIELNGERILLTHGDQYCTLDRSHQWLRRLTRNRIFTRIFLNISYATRKTWVTRVREHSQNNASKPAWSMQIVSSVMLAHMRWKKVNTVIHGHIHQPGLISHSFQGEHFHQYVLSDWDDNPQLLCYYNPKGFCFIPFTGGD